MEMAKSIPEYFESNKEWHAELDYLRHLLLGTELVETLKWGIPTYTIANKNVLGIAAFKSYVGMWFYQGVFLTDHANVLINAQEGVTKGMRQWRFSSIEEMNASLILSYVEEAIQNQKEGKEIKIERNKAFDIPAELKDVLNKDAKLTTAFKRLTSFKQKEYAQYIESAKQQATKLKRIDKICPMILDNIGLNDKYRK